MKRALLWVLTLLLCLPAVGQQRHIQRYDLFTGYSYLLTPVLDLPQQGFNGSVGMNVRRWLALGADVGVWSGNTGLKVNMTKLATPLSSMLPPALLNYGVTTNASTWTFAAGPQINIRRWEKFTPFVRPGLGVMHEKIAIHYAGTPFQPLLPAFQRVAPGLAAQQADQVVFYGAGGGVDLRVSQILGLRLSLDYVRSNMFNSVLPPQNNFRFSIGPQFKFGEMRQGRK